MARLATTGYEWNDPTSGFFDPPIGTGVTVVGSPVRSGSFAQKIDQTVLRGANAGIPVVAITGGLSTTYFLRAYVNFSSLGVAGSAGNFVGVLGCNTANATFGVGLTNGVLQFRTPASSALTGATFTPSTSVWYRIETSYQSSSGAWEWRVDGATIATGTSTSATAPASFVTGGFDNTGTGNLWVANFDDCAVNDSTGAAQTSWCGDGKIVLLLPASDNAKGTGWTNDAAGASNFFDAVNNTPPVGIADTTVGSGLHQIRNATANASSNYDANLTTYAAGGIGAADTVNVLLPMVAVAAPVTTSAKAGTFGVSSNPAITNVTLAAGAGTAGAFWAGSAAATYESGWKASFGTTTYAPTVTLGSAPVARITQVTSSTRIAMVCAMGMYVEYVAAPPPDLGLGLTVT